MNELTPDGDKLGNAEDLVWGFDPSDQALDASHNRNGLPDPFCGEVGRRLLLAELQFNRWVLRRVEKVSFEQDRNVTRKLTIDLNVREDAPLVMDKAGDEFWIVPLTLMRRRTLVNMRITDEDGRLLPIPGLRLTQQLDESILLAATATVSRELAGQKEVRNFIRELVSGMREETKRAMDRFEGTPSDPIPAYLLDLAKSPLVRAVVYILRRNFSLYVFLPAGKHHRILSLEFSEPTGWTRMTPSMTTIDTPAGKVKKYSYDDRPAQSIPIRWRFRQAGRKLWPGLPAALGLWPTRIRVQVPGAENAASYHLELTAPEGVEVVDARLLAGRPDEGQSRYTNDHVVGHTATVGLHGVEVPNGSLCQAQVDIRVTSRGWLTNAICSCAFVTVVLGALIWQACTHDMSWPTAQITNIIALLITTAAAVGAMIVHLSFNGVAARMVARMRGLAAVAVIQPVVAAGALAFAEEGERDGASSVRLDNGTMVVLWTTMGLAVGVTALILGALVISVVVERRSSTVPSPWDMTVDGDTKEEQPPNYMEALKAFEFTVSAIGILSAEGWHERYAWTNERQDAAVQALEGMASEPLPRTCGWNGHYTTCLVADLCPYRKRFRTKWQKAISSSNVE